MWTWLDAIYFICWMEEEFFYKLKYVFDNSIRLSIIYGEFINVH